MTKRIAFIRWYRLVAVACSAAIPVLAGAAVAAPCSKADFAAAVDAAGAKLRQFNAEANPKLKSRLDELAKDKGWRDAEVEERGFEYLQDRRIAAFDEEASELLSKVDELGRVDDKAEPDCAKLSELQKAAEKLLGVMKAKSDYSLAKLDRELGGAEPAAAKTPDAPVQPPATSRPAPAKTEPWSTTTSKAPADTWSDARAIDSAPTSTPAPALPPGAFVTDEQGYTIDEIREASRGLFGTISTELAAVIEHAFAKSGRPTAYVLGTEGGGAFLAGLRYGKGTLYLRAGGSQTVYWHGPSVGGDIGAEGAKILYLIYNLKDGDGLFRRFGGIDGSAYFVGGVGIKLLKGGDVTMAPIRSGLGLRLGASIGYVKFTRSPTWNPF
jgi:hypothetical protein